MNGLDSETILVVSTMMMLANGAVLGMMHRDLPLSLRPAAVLWQAGVVLIALGCVAFASLPYAPSQYTTTVSNGLVLLGLAAFWQALRRFYDRPASVRVLLVALAPIPLLHYFNAVAPNLLARILIVTVAWTVLIGGSAWTLYTRRKSDEARSRRVLAGIFVVLGLFTIVRGVFYLFADPGFVVVDNSNLMNRLTPLFTVAGPVIGTTAFVLMCSERMSRQWEQAASTDYLTGLFNRRVVTEEALRHFAGETRKAAGALAILDIDHFKRINDTYGHETGDEVLRHVARELRDVTRADELLGRFGGEEFVVLLKGLDDEAQARQTSERLRERIAATPCPTDSGVVPITVSIGVAVAERGESFQSLIRRADRALYRAKTNGRNRVEVAQAPDDDIPPSPEPQSPSAR